MKKNTGKKCLANKIAIILLVVFIFSLFVPTAYAEKSGLSDSDQAKLQGITSLLSPIATLQTIIGTLVGWVAHIFESAIRWQHFEDVRVVQTSWEIVRDFVNMFFILILIVIAFGTVLGLEKYSVTTPGIVPKLLIAALLINFSLPIAGIIIDVSHVFSNVFLRTVGEFTGTIVNQTGLTKLFKVSQEPQYSGVVGQAQLAWDLGSIISRAGFQGFFTAAIQTQIHALFTLIILVITFFALLAAAIFTLIRIPILWALLIISPVAWVASILPATQGLWKTWWDYFLGWTFFLPVYLFMLTIGLAILGSQGEISPLLASFDEGTASAFTLANFTVQNIFFYLVAIIILVFGLKAALSVGMFASTGASSAFGTIKGGVEGWAKRATYISALQKGVGEKAREIREKGLPGKAGLIYGGERAERLREARVKGLLGEPTAVQQEKERQLKEDIDKIKGQLKTVDAGQLKARMGSGRLAQQLAARELLNEKRELGAKELAETYELYGGNRSLLGKGFAKNIDYGKLSEAERTKLYGEIGMTDPELARKITTAQAEKGDLKKSSGWTSDELIKRANLFTTEGERREFFDNVKKKNYEESIRAMIQLGLIKDSAGNPLPDSPEGLNSAIEEDFKKMTLDKILEFHPGTLEDLTKNPAIKDLMARKITKNTIGALESKATKVQLDVLQNVIEERKKEIETAEEESIKKRATLEERARQEVRSQASPPKRQAGFVPQGSTVTEGGEVKTPEPNKEKAEGVSYKNSPIKTITADVPKENVVNLRDNNDLES